MTESERNQRDYEAFLGLAESDAPKGLRDQYIERVARSLLQGRNTCAGVEEIAEARVLIKRMGFREPGAPSSETLFCGTCKRKYLASWLKKVSEKDGRWMCDGCCELKKP